MERPQAHVTGDLGASQLTNVLVEAGWSVNPMRSDYGIDFDVEIFEQGKSTGRWFKLQLKSSERTQYGADKSFVSESLSAEHLRHYANEISDPCLLIHADVVAKRTFWLPLQLDNLANNISGASVTVRIPTQNELPQNLPALALDIERSRSLLASRSYVDQSLEDLNRLIPQSQVNDLFERQIKTEATACWHGERTANILKFETELLRGNARNTGPNSKFCEFKFFGNADVEMYDWPYPPPEAGHSPEEAKRIRQSQKPNYSQRMQISGLMQVSFQSVNGQATALRLEGFRKLAHLRDEIRRNVAPTNT